MTVQRCARSVCNQTQHLQITIPGSSLSTPNTYYASLEDVACSGTSCTLTGLCTETVIECGCKIAMHFNYM